MITGEIYKKYADYLGVETCAFKAVIDVESSGYGIDPLSGKVVIRWEGHKFRKFITDPAILKQAEKRNLAFKYRDRHKPQNRQPEDMNGRHLLLEQAMMLDAKAAMRSISMGLGQIMGFHAERLGFRDVFEMWKENQTIDGQVATMAQYIRAFGLIDELKNLDWAGFAAGYNGPNYKDNDYDEKLKKAYLKYGGTGTYKRNIILKLGSRGSEVEVLQGMLQGQGYQIKIDGAFGEKTRNQVMLFQIDHNLEPDGIVGQNTFNILEKLPPQPICETEVIDDLKQNSRIMKNASWLDRIGFGGILTVGSAELFDFGSDLDFIMMVTQKIQPILNLISNNWRLLVFAICVFIIVKANQVMNARIDDKIQGKTL